MSNRLKSFRLLNGVIFLIVMYSTLWTTDLSLVGKSISFYMDSVSGNFYLVNPSPSSAELKNLLFWDNPPTSYLTLQLEGKPYKLTDSKLKRLKDFYISNNSIIGVFAVEGLKNIQFTVQFILTNSSEANQFDSVIFLVRAENNSDKAVSIGARFMFDTYYNEPMGKPLIYLDSTEQVSYEWLLKGATIPDYIFCGKYDSDDLSRNEGIYIYPSINNLAPTQIIIGNWKKFYVNEWDYHVVPKEQFKYNQFSNKDAAVAVYYQDINLKPNEVLNYGSLLTRNLFSYQPIPALESFSMITQTVTVTPAPTNSNRSCTECGSNGVSTEQDTLAATENISSYASTEQSNTVSTPTSSNLTESQFVLSEFSDTNLSSTQVWLISNQIILMQKLTDMIGNVERILSTNIESIQQENKQLEQSVESYKQQLENQKKEYEENLDQLNKELEETLKLYNKKLNEDPNLKSKNEYLNRLEKLLESVDRQIELIEELRKLDLGLDTVADEQIQQLYNSIIGLQQSFYILENE